MESFSSQRWWVLGAMVFAMLAVGLDVTILSVALPTLAVALHASTVQLQWFVAAYALVLAAALLPGGLLGDRYGRKKMLLISLTIFGIGSVVCAFANSPGIFILARVVAGLGAAFAIPLSLSMLTVLFSEQERPRAIGIWGAANFLGLPIGPILGGWLLTHYWWGSVFLINVPVVILGITAIAILMPESRSSQRPGLDWVGMISSSAGLALLIYGFVLAGENGWGDIGVLSSIVGGVLVLVAFWGWERRITHQSSGTPLVDLGLFSSASFTWGTFLGTLGTFAMIAVLFTAPQYFQAILGTDAMGSGLRLLPLIGGVVLGGGGANRVVTRVGTRVTVVTGFALLAAALILGSATGADSGFAFVAAWTALIGAGMGVVFATAASAALGQLAPERAGVGSALMQAIMKVGAPLGAAILGSVLNSGYRSRLDLGGLPLDAANGARNNVFTAIAVARKLKSTTLLNSVRAAFMHGMDLMLLVCGGIAIAGLGLAIAFLPKRKPAIQGIVEHIRKEADHLD